MEKLAGLGVQVDKLPNECPYCHKLIRPIEQCKSTVEESDIEIVFKCTNNACRKLFIAKYRPYGATYSFISCNFGYFKKITFEDIINEISPSFVKIYNESYFAEQDKLLEICGVGYRKSVEFLIKDYLIKNNPENEESIKKKFLGKCIVEDVTNLNIKRVAERAVWLGNDETHYVREWEEKSLKDLKNLIDLIVHWIEYEEITIKMFEDMPDNKK